MGSLLPRVVAGFGIVFTVACMLYAGSPADPLWWPGAALFLLWALAPYAIVLGCSLAWKSRVAQTLLAVGAVAALLPVPFIAYEAFAAHRRALDGIMFLFLPVYQLFAVIGFALAAWWAARRDAVE